MMSCHMVRHAFKSLAEEYNTVYCNKLYRIKIVKLISDILRSSKACNNSHTYTTLSAENNKLLRAYNSNNKSYVQVLHTNVRLI